jgi:hypothetical protein
LQRLRNLNARHSFNPDGFEELSRERFSQGRADNGQPAGQAWSGNSKDCARSRLLWKLLRLSFDLEDSIKKARHLIDLYERTAHPESAC